MPRTLLVYMMYDVQPEETGWQTPAFDGTLKDTELGRVLMARGRDAADVAMPFGTSAG